MSENIEPRPDLPDTVSLDSFAVGSPESRAAARRFLERGAARILKWGYVQGLQLDADDNPIEGPIRICEPASATLSGFQSTPVEFVRLDSETREQFEARVVAAVPVAGPPGSNEYFIWNLTFHPRKDSPTS
jgi:hypothetical protein